MIIQGNDLQKVVGGYCKSYRDSIGATLNEVGGDELVKNVSGFEHGRSSHLKYLVYYTWLADRNGDGEQFQEGLTSTIRQYIREGTGLDVEKLTK